MSDKHKIEVAGEPTGGRVYDVVWRRDVFRVFMGRFTGRDRTGGPLGVSSRGITRKPPQLAAEATSGEAQSLGGHGS